MLTPNATFSQNWAAFKKTQRLATLAKNPANRQIMTTAQPITPPAAATVTLAAKPPATTPPPPATASSAPGLTITNVREKVEGIAAQAGPPFLAHLKSEIARAEQGRDIFKEMAWTLNGRLIQVYLFSVRPYAGGLGKYSVRTVAVTMAPEIAEHFLAQDWVAKVRQATRQDVWQFASESIRELGAEADFPQN